MAGMVSIKTITEESMAQAKVLLEGGACVAFPTETVYGLGANAFDGQAVAKIYETKGRPSFNPLIVHVRDMEAAQELAEFSDDARALAAQFWPGPLTLVLPKLSGCRVSELAMAGLETIALRCPAHKGAQRLLGALDFPLVAPSANASGSVSPTTPAHVADSLGDKLKLILADGACSVGLESTIVDCSGDQPVILRPGVVTAEMIEGCLGKLPVYAGQGQGVKAPGMLSKHYAPGLPVRLNAIDLEPGEVLLGFGSLKFMGVRGGGAALNLPDTQVRNLSADMDLYEAAANLFAMLRALDRPAHKGIAVMAIPEEGLGVAINDRLRRAACKD